MIAPSWAGAITVTVAIERLHTQEGQDNCFKASGGLSEYNLAGVSFAYRYSTGWRSCESMSYDPPHRRAT